MTLTIQILYLFGGFQMLDLKGNMIIDLQGNLNPVYYPNIMDFSYQATVLKSL